MKKEGIESENKGIHYWGPVYYYDTEQVELF